MNLSAAYRQIKLGFSTLALCYASWSGTALAQTVVVSQCNGECPNYQSSASQRNANIVIHHVYAASLNGQTGIADWVAYRLTKEAIGVASLLSRQWQPDRLISVPNELEILESSVAEISLASIAVNNNPYAGINSPAPDKEDRARLAPITSFANTPYWADLNNLSNMVPMPSELRLGPWLRLEQALNILAAKRGELYVVSGPLFLITESLSSNNSLAALNPAAYFKVVTSGDEMAVFVFPNTLSQVESYCGHTSSLSDLETMSGLNVLPNKQLKVSQALLTDLGCH
jgi:endonuclease G, mitochondrial